MTSKLLFAFDLKSRPEASYKAIRTWISANFGTHGFKEILNTTYIIKSTLTPNDFIGKIQAAKLILNGDRCFCDNVSTSRQGLLKEEERTFIKS